MYRNTRLPAQQQSYIEDIKSTQNILRTKLPHFLSYRPDKHFEYLTGHNRKAQNKTKINLNVLEQLIPFINDYQEFKPGMYLEEAVNQLNGNGDRDGLGYRGYLKLITTERNCDSRGSQVNKTLFNRITMDCELSTKFTTTSLKQNQQIDLVIGLLLFLECLRVAQQNQYNYRHRIQVEIGQKTVKKSQLQHPDRVKQKSDNVQTVYHGSFGRGLLMMDSMTKHKQGNTITLNPEEASRKRTRKPIFQGHATQKSNTDITPQIRKEFYSKQNLPKQNADEQLKIDFLERFSSEQNLWKNMSQRNQYKGLSATKTNYKSNASNDSAFYYQQMSTSPRIYLKSPRAKPMPRIINRIDEYYRQ